jgi:RNA recognition motif-containing protein
MAQTFEVGSNSLEANAEADELEAQAAAFAKRAKELRMAAQHIQAETMAGHGSSLESNMATHAGRTTLVVKNLPAGCTHDELRRILDEVGLGGLYNFVYVPFDFKKSVVFRYGFVNFEQHEQAVKAMAILDGFSGWVVNGEKGCEVEWSGAQQSLHALIERYRNSPVMHDRVPDAYKPLLFERGVQIPFPAPTQAVNPPKHANQSSLQPNAEAEKLEVQAEASPMCAQESRGAVQLVQVKQAAAQSPETHDCRTTLIVKNLPAGCTHNELHKTLDEVGLGGLYNFIYIPFDFKKGVTLRYGFVNFEEHEHAVRATAILHGFSGWVVDGEKGCEVEWGGAQQSLHANIERYRNSPLMHASVPDAYKPVLFERGVRAAFPAPTQAVKQMKLRRVQQS